MATKEKIEDALVQTKTWMNSVRLKMNDAKTEFIYFGNKRFLSLSQVQTLHMNGEEIKKSDCVRLLGAWLDANLGFKQHVRTKVKKAMSNLFRLKKIRKFLTKEACESLVLSLCISHLDYANCLLVGLPDVTLKPLQMVQNMCAKLVLNRDKYQSNMKALRDLHWLPIRSRICFKLLSIVFKTLNNEGPKYLKDMLIIEQKGRTGLRSSSNNNLLVPFTAKKTHASRSFSVKGPHLWNNLPIDIRNSLSTEEFKAKLKTYLFNKPNFYYT